MENKQKIVDFHKWCKSCKHEKKPEYEDPCNECLDYPVNEDSTKPVNWEEK